jgi:two-component system LytT family response regulator
MTIISTAVADDERLLREKLRGFLAEVTWVRLVGETVDGPSTVQMVDDLKPDLLFLDVRMPGLTGSTAYDRYAVAAFEAQALDYLLKPFGRKRFFATLNRVRETLQARAALSTVERGRAALAPEEPLTRLFVRGRGKITPVAVRDVDRFEARDDYVLIHAGQQRHLASVRMNDLERQLESAHFLRIHRSHIVNLDAVVSFAPHESGRLLVTMRDGATLFASRARSRALRDLAV